MSIPPICSGSWNVPSQTVLGTTIITFTLSGPRGAVCCTVCRGTPRCWYVSWYDAEGTLRADLTPLDLPMTPSAFSVTFSSRPTPRKCLFPTSPPTTLHHFSSTKSKASHPTSLISPTTSCFTSHQPKPTQQSQDTSQRTTQTIHPNRRKL
jgi:hypothetical protein